MGLTGVSRDRPDDFLTEDIRGEAAGGDRQARAAGCEAQEGGGGVDIPDVQGDEEMNRLGTLY